MMDTQHQPDGRVMAALLADDATTNFDRDVTVIDETLTIDDAYALQLASMAEIAVRRGETIGGYQASVTSSAAQTMAPTMPFPMVGTLLATQFVAAGSTVVLDRRYERYGVESELGMVLGVDLAGPHVTPEAARAAVVSVVAAIELAPIRIGSLEGRWSNQQLVATHNRGSTVVIGTPRNLDQTDLRTEGLVCSIDHVLRGTATGAEAMGDPFVVLAEMANRLGRHGVGLKAGHTVITGSCIPPQAVAPGDVGHVLLETTRLGSVEVNLR